MVAPHPDDAELGMAGAILRAKAEGMRVGILDLTSGEPTPHGTPEIRARETAAATEILGVDWRENLGLPNRKLEHTLEARALIGRCVSSRAAAIDLCPLLGRLASRSRGRDRNDRGGPVLVEADQIGLAGRAVFSLAHSVLLLRALAAGDAAGFRARYQRSTGSASGPRSSAITASSSRDAKIRSPSFIDRLRDQAAFWGWSIGVDYAEPFASREPVGVSSLRDLV